MRAWLTMTILVNCVLPGWCQAQEGTLPELAEPGGGLRIGASRDLKAGTFWPCLIDDVRIYDRVVEP